MEIDFGEDSEIPLIIADAILSEYGLTIWGYADKIEVLDKKKFAKCLKNFVIEWSNRYLKED